MNLKPYNAKKGKTEWVYRTIVEDVLGYELPKGTIIHHADGDRYNNETNNLVICEDRKYHHLLHVRQRALKCAGSIDARPCKYCGSFDLISEMKSDTYKGCTAHYHKTCKAVFESRRR